MEINGPHNPCGLSGCPICYPLRGTPERDDELRLMARIEAEQHQPVRSFNRDEHYREG